MAVNEAGRSTPLLFGSGTRGAAADEVSAALEQILASEAFAHVERPSRFLRHIVETALNGQQTRLKETLLGIQVFGREPSWDTRIDPIVRQEASRLRKRLARYYETASPDIRIELPVGTYVPVFHRLAPKPADAETPPAPILEAPGPLANAAGSPAPVVLKDTAGKRVPRAAWLLAGASLLLVAVSVWAWRSLRPASEIGGPPSIVVLPFTNLSADPANEYFAEGLTDEITGELVRLKSLKVLARASAMAFKGKTVDVRDVGRGLHVSYVLEGSVERSAEQVRISAHLERAADGSQVWSATYDRQAKDLPTVQSELAAAIARNLQLSSGLPGKPPHIPNEEAHDLYMRAAFEMQDNTPGSISRAELALQRAVRIDPGYAVAWYDLGLAKFNASVADGRSRTPAELAEAKDLFHKALTLDPDLSSAHATLGRIAMVYDWDWAAAERELQLASRNGLNSTAESNYGLLLSYRGQFSEADRHLELARSLDPANSEMLVNLIAVRYWESRFQEAIALGRQMLQRYPDQLNPQFMMNISYIEAGEPEQALSNLRPLETRYPPIRFFEVMALSRSGRRGEGLSLMRQLETQYERDSRVFRQWFALAWASLGDRARAVKWLEKSADLREFQVLNLAVNPAFAEMRDDPEFRALVKRIGL